MKASPLANSQLEVSSGYNNEPLDRLLYWLGLTMLIKAANSEWNTHTHTTYLTPTEEDAIKLFWKPD